MDELERRAVARPTLEALYWLADKFKMPVFQERLLRVPAGGTITLVRLDCELTLTTDVPTRKGG